MTVALHRIDQNRNKRPKPLAADAIARLPQHREGLMYRLIVKSPPWAWALWRRRLIQYAQRVFARYRLLVRIRIGSAVAPAVLSPLETVL